MKTYPSIYLLLFLLLPFFISQKIYAQSVVKEGNTWMTKDFADGTPFFRMYKIGGDTTINSMTYKKVEIHEDTLPNIWTTANYFVRESNGQVFKYVNNNEWVILNFNLAVGDTINEPFTEFYVTEIDSIEMLNGAMRQRITFENPTYNCIAPPLIEGVGNAQYPPFWDWYCWDLVNELLVCFYENEELVFSTGVDICENTTAAETIFLAKNNIKIFPNPTDEILTIDNLPKDRLLKNVQIFDVVGKLILEKQYNYKIKNERENISISNLRQGSYVLKINFAEGSQSILFFKK